MHSLAILFLIVDALHVPVTIVLFKVPMLWTPGQACRQLAD